MPKRNSFSFNSPVGVLVLGIELEWIPTASNIEGGLNAKNKFLFGNLIKNSRLWNVELYSSISD